MTINRNVKSVKRVITSGIALVLLVSVCSACIWGVVSVAKNGIATSDTATWGIGTDGLATNGLATNGVATGGIGIATDGVATEGNSTEYDIYAPIKNVLVATGEVTWEELNRKEQLPGLPLEVYVRNGIELTLDELLRTPEYLRGKLDYLFVEDAYSKALSMEKVVLETVASCESDALARAASTGYSNVSHYNTIESDYLMATNNYKQSTYNYYYAQDYGVEYTGTCSEIACLSVIEYYYRKGYGGTLGHSYRYTIFNRLLNEAIECGAFPSDGDEGGTWVTKVKNVISGYYDYYSVNLDGNYDVLSTHQTIETYTSKVKPVVGHFKAPNGEGHDMCVCGYYDVVIKYKATTNTYQYLTYRYYRVNSGWKEAYSSNSNSTDDRLQYIWEGYLKGVTKIE